MKIEKQVRNGATWVNVVLDCGLEAELCSTGAGTNRIAYKGRRLTLTLKDREFYRQSNQFFGKTLGRVAGRLPLEYEFNNRILHLDATEKYDDLHGGKMNSFSFKEWDTQVEAKDDRAIVAFSRLSPDGECHFPGNLNTKVTYEFVEGDAPEIHIGFHADTDSSALISYSNHIYWDLTDDNDVSSQVLYMNADRYGTDNGVSQLITGVGPILDCLDFRQASKLGPKLDIVEKELPTKTIDHTFLYSEVRTDAPQATLENDRIRLELYTDMDAMNVYVDNSQTPVSFENGENLTAKRRAIALEPQQFLLNQKNISITKGENWDHWIKYKIIEK